jgi:hypothetical protein
MSKTVYRHNRRSRHSNHWSLYALAAVLLTALALGYWTRHQHSEVTLLTPKTGSVDPGVNGAVLGVDAVKYFSPASAEVVAKENYAAATPPITTGVDKITFHYRSHELDGTPIVIYGRAYLPDDPASHLPVFAFAPGTTGIGDDCAASLENVAKANWGNYDSHLITYASQGYAVVTTDYEGMRDSDRLHHYMVGPLEGRALLDAIRGLENLSQASGRLDLGNVFVAGYSQGGHAAFWADTIDAQYAPEIHIKGVVGYGPVLDVEATMNDVVRGSILDWFGPFVLTSYADYYHQDFNTDQILQPRFNATLTADVLDHCVDTAYSFWGHDANAVYTPEYLAAVKAGTFAARYPQLTADLAVNATGTEATSSAKLINEGRYDLVVMPQQAETALPTMCHNSTGPVALKIYPSATHFNTMVVSLKDTLDWLKQLRAGVTPASTCPPA